MGGCRCTYRNCTVRTDGSTHLFHYPVFDKYRCHQWLTNAQRLDFLNLKVSQLKNRVVCQHHFTDDMFMNFKKDKLKCCAVPTEDGPFCEPSNDSKDTKNVLYPINVEQIENEFINSNGDKKATFSVKYGDFLANCELMQLTDAEYEQGSESKPNLTRRKTRSKIQSRSPVIKIHFDNDVEFTDKKYFIEVDQNCETLTSAKTNEDDTSGIKNIVSETPEQITITYKDDSTVQNQADDKKQQSKVKILSEEPFNQQLPEVPTLIPIPPNYVLNVPVKKNKVEVGNNNISYVYNLGLLENSVQTELCSQSTAGVAQDQENNEPNLNEQDKSLVTHKHISNFTTANTPRNKSISDERIASIQEKRLFNKKLRDIITDSLNLLEEPVEANAKKSKSEISSEHDISDEQKPVVRFLETRMNRMEEKLLQKIDSNRKLILEMKKVMCDVTKGKEKKHSVHTQTDIYNELHKKNLFHEISKYLSADAKSLIYEELFINEHVEPKLMQPEPMRSSSKRRKYGKEQVIYYQ